MVLPHTTVSGLQTQNFNYISDLHLHLKCISETWSNIHERKRFNFVLQGRSNAKNTKVSRFQYSICDLGISQKLKDGNTVQIAFTHNLSTFHSKQNWQ